MERAPVRGTQTFVGTMAWVWKHPSLTGLEILWRWLWGLPALWLVVRTVNRILGAYPIDWQTLEHLSIFDPLHASEVIGAAAATLLPPFRQAFVWLAPLLLLTWVVAHTIGRGIVLHRIDSGFRQRPLTLLLLGALRLAALAVSFWLWWKSLLWASSFAIAAPIAAGREPNLVLYCTLAIIATIGIFFAWGLVSWIFAMAPLLALLSDLSPAAALRQAFGVRGDLRQKLVEINLVMGIVKIALLVLAMVFSATPLPFSSVTTEGFLHLWWAGVTVLYFVGSDFFHVVRLAAYLQLHRKLLVTSA